jgi:hypothetical protein
LQSRATEPYGQKWRVKGGECAIFWADSRAAVDAFLYGMGLAYVLWPEPTFARLRAEVKRLME